MRAQPEEANLRARVYALWLEGMDTYAMSRALHIPEHQCERALHQGMDIKRAFRNSLEASA